MGLIRKSYSSPALSDIYRPWIDFIQGYESDAIVHTWKDFFSKTEAIHSLHADLDGHQKVPEAENLLRALLTDRGLLFPQTRERGYHIEYSMKRSSTGSPWRSRELAKMAPENLNEADRILYFGEQVYRKRQQRFEGRYPLISLEKTLSGIHALIDGRDGPFRIVSVKRAYQGCYPGDLDMIGYDEKPEEVEYIMTEWLRAQRFSWNNDLEWLSVDAIIQVLKFSTAELYEFLACILPECLFKEEQYRDLLATGTGYSAAINTAQLERFQYQIVCYHQEDLSQWKTALPVLGEYLHPDFAPFEDGCSADEITDNNQVLKNLQSELSEAFLTYLSHMEPSSSKSNPTVLAKRTSEMHRMANWFLTAASGGTGNNAEPFLFLTRPHLIFHLFRSPMHRYVTNYENRGWNLKRVIEDAYIRNPLPITNQSLNADQDLFLKIVDICMKMCQNAESAFPYDAWKALWKCIAQSVLCLQYQESDLVSASYGFIHVLSLREMGSPVIDKWIAEQLTAEAPNYIGIWRAIVNKYCSLSRKETNKWIADVGKFRSSFESATTISDEIYSQLEVLCNQINWTGIRFLPPPNELAAIDEHIRPRARKGTAAVIRSGQKGDAEQQYKFLWMEWLLVQCVSDQARRELMESVYLYLTEAEKDPV